MKDIFLHLLCSKDNVAEASVLWFGSVHRNFAVVDIESEFLEMDFEVLSSDILFEAAHKDFLVLFSLLLLFVLLRGHEAIQLHLIFADIKVVVEDLVFDWL